MKQTKRTGNAGHVAKLMLAALMTGALMLNVVLPVAGQTGSPDKKRPSTTISEQGDQKKRKPERDKSVETPLVAQPSLHIVKLQSTTVGDQQAQKEQPRRKKRDAGIPDDESAKTPVVKETTASVDADQKTAANQEITNEKQPDGKRHRRKKEEPAQSPAPTEQREPRLPTIPQPNSGEPQLPALPHPNIGQVDVKKVGDWADEVVTHPRPTLRGYLRNAGAINSLKARIDHRPAEVAYDRSSGAFSVTPASDLEPGEHEVRLIAIWDNARRQNLTIMIFYAPDFQDPPKTNTPLCKYIEANEPGKKSKEEISIWARNGEEAVLGEKPAFYWYEVGKLIKEKSADGMVKMTVEATTYNLDALDLANEAEYYNFKTPKDGQNWGLVNERSSGYLHIYGKNCDPNKHEPWMQVNLNADVALDGDVKVESASIAPGEWTVFAKMQAEVWTEGISPGQYEIRTIELRQKHNDPAPKITLSVQMGTKKEGPESGVSGSVEWQPTQTRELLVAKDTLPYHKEGMLHERGTLNYKGTVSLDFLLNDYKLKAEVRVAPTKFEVKRKKECHDLGCPVK